MKGVVLVMKVIMNVTVLPYFDAFNSFGIQDDLFAYDFAVETKGLMDDVNFSHSDLRRVAGNSFCGSIDILCAIKYGKWSIFRTQYLKQHKTI